MYVYGYQYKIYNSKKLWRRFVRMYLEWMEIIIDLAEKIHLRKFYSDQRRAKQCIFITINMHLRTHRYAKYNFAIIFLRSWTIFHLLHIIIDVVENRIIMHLYIKSGL